MGPKSADLLARLVRVDLDPRVFGDRRLALTGAAGVPLQVLRWDRGGVLAWELLVGRDVAEYFAETLERAGEGLGLRWIGEEAFAAVAGGEE
jgi:glycine cleavage system aminomethyltransferase T